MKLRNLLAGAVGIIMGMSVIFSVPVVSMAQEQEEAVTADIQEHLWELDESMSDEEFLKLATRNFKIVQSMELLFDEDSYFQYYKAMTHLKQNAEGSREEFLEKQNNLVMKQTVADGVWYVWPEGKIPGIDGESFTEEELDASALDGYGFRPLVVKCLLNDPSTAKGNILAIAGGAGSNRSNSAEAYPAAEVFNDLGYNVFVLQYRISPYSGDYGYMDAQRAVRLIKYYGEKEGYGGMDMIAAVGWSAGSGRVKGLINNLYGYLTPKDVYCSSYEPDEIDAISSDLDVAMLLYGPGELNPENPNWPACYICAGSEDDKGFNGGDGAATGSRKMYEAIKDTVPAMVNIIEGAGHGFGVGQEGAAKSTPECALWPAQADEFMQANRGFQQNR